MRMVQRPRRKILRYLLGGGVVSSGAMLAWVHDSDQDLQRLNDGGLPNTYQPEKINEYWGQHPKVAVGRLLTITGSTVPFLARLLWTRWMGELQDEEVQKQFAVEFRLLVIVRHMRIELIGIIM